jgi:hypothetical protein
LEFTPRRSDGEERRLNRWLRPVQGVMLAWLVLSFVVQLDIGLADNGDYTRVMGPITSGPIGFNSRPTPGTPESFQRFFHYWLPYWRLDGPVDWPRTSELLLWLPGAWLSSALFSRNVLWMPVLGLPIKALLIVSVLGVLAWIERRASHCRSILTLVIAGPLVLLLSTTDFVAYINTFYREAGSTTYLLAFLASTLFLKVNPHSSRRQLLCLTTVALLTMSKPSNVYWPVIGVPLIFLLRARRISWRHAGISAALIIAIALVSLRVTADHTSRTTVWDSLFSSALLLSADPSSHLARLEMPDAAPCIGRPIFVGIGADCYARYKDVVTPAHALTVVAREPTIVARQLLFGASALQDLSIEWYGIYRADDPRSQTAPATEGPPDTRFWGRRSNQLFNVWSAIQYTLFPRGPLALAVLIGLVPVWWRAFRSGGFAQDLGLIGAVTSAAVWLDILVQVGAEGRQDLIRHLFMANILFALTIIAAAGIGVHVLTQGMRPARVSRAEPSPAREANPESMRTRWSREIKRERRPT